MAKTKTKSRKISLRRKRNQSNKKYMKKSKKNNFLKKLKNSSEKAIPVVASGLKKVGTTVQNIAVKSEPIVTKGLDTIYGTMATGFDMGIKGVKSGVTIMSKKNRNRK